MGFDIQTYRANEDLAKSHLPSWRIAQRHNLDVFERSGFPVRLNSLQQVRQLVDTMQEQRFDLYMKEMGGFTEDEMRSFISACRKAVQFQAAHFPQKKIILPVNALIAAFALYRKVSLLRPDFKRILEIGPGCGYLAFFLKEYGELVNYSQIEACESFYLLQHLQNRFLFQHEFEQRAYINKNLPLDFCVPGLSADGEVPSSPRAEIENPYYNQNRCCQFPWWKIGEFAQDSRRFDLVTSNANLLEFSPGALNEYLSLIRQKLDRNGVFLVQCFGWGEANSIDALWDKLFRSGFAPLFLTDNLYIDVEKVIAMVPAGVECIAMAPAGNAARLLLRNKVFRNRFKEIVLLDNFKQGQKVEGLEVRSPAALKEEKVQYGLVLHWNSAIARDLGEVFGKAGVKAISPETGPEAFKIFAVPNGVFVTDRHQLFNDFHEGEYYCNSSQSLLPKFVAEAFFRNKENARLYGVEDIIERIRQKIAP